MAMNLPSKNWGEFKKRGVFADRPLRLTDKHTARNNRLRSEAAGGAAKAPAKPGRYAEMAQHPLVNLKTPHPAPLAGIQAVVHNTVPGVVRSS